MTTLEWPSIDPARFLATERQECEAHLHTYAKAAWHIVEPGRGFIDGEHIKLISRHLEAAFNGSVRNVLINIPPRHMKSLLVSVFFPTWVWGPKKRPEARFLCASYAESLAIRDSLKCRRIIQHPWYQERWADVFRITSDQNQKGRFENDKTGYRLAVGVGGSSTGEGGDFLIVDDPLKAQDSYSVAAIDAVNAWWDNTLSTRGNDPRKTVRIVIMQRLAENDLSGHILEKQHESGSDTWDVLCLPAEYEPQPYVSFLGKADWRETPGELLWPEVFDRKALETLKADMTPQFAAGQLQQRPAPMGGLIYHREWWEGQNRFNISNKARRNQAVARWLSLDTAFEKTETSAYTACVWFELAPDYRAAVTRVARERLEFPDLVEFTKEQIAQANKDSKLRGIIIEARATGRPLVQTCQQTLPKEFAEKVISYQPHGSKDERAMRAAVWCQKGCVLLPNPATSCPWLFDFETELFNAGSSTTYMDQADAFAQGVDYLSNLLEEGFQVRLEAGSN